MAKKPNATAVKAISAVVGVLSLLILVQAITGGVIAREASHKGVIDAHQGLAYLVAVLAVATVVIALLMWQGRTGGQVVVAESVALLVCVIIQIGIGQQIGKAGHSALLAIHVPLALIIFGIALHMSTYVANLRRSGS